MKHFPERFICRVHNIGFVEHDDFLSHLHGHITEINNRRINLYFTLRRDGTWSKQVLRFST